MRRAAALLPFLVWGAVSAEDFISEFEYGQMLYQDPRGVSCVPCHGDRGEGRLIARYKEGGVLRELRGPDIRETDLEAIRKAVSTGPGVMPRYFLTEEEIRALYTYIREAERRSLEEPE
jgi:mono/diheme cytochrome c family protein